MSRRRIRRGERGAIAPLAALLLAALFGFGALAVDLGRMHLERRALQAAVDSAALSAARAPAQAAALASGMMARQGYADAPLTVEVGRFQDDPGLPIAARFASGTDPDAVRVTATTRVPWALAQVLIGPGEANIGASATAAHRPLAAFTIGSGVASLDAGILNRVLSAMLGGNVALGAASYAGLAGAELSLFRFADALGTRLGLAAGSYEQLLASDIAVGDLLDVAAGALAAEEGDARLALQALSQATLAGRSLRVGELLGLSVHQARRVGSFGADRSYLDLGANLVDVATAAAALGGPDSAVALGSAIQLPGLANVGAQLRLIEPPVASGTGAAALGPVGATARTAQARLLLSVQLLQLISGGVVTLPVLVEAAPATAELTAVACQGEPGEDATVSILATTGLARARIGEVPLAAFADPSALPGTLAPAPILSVTLQVLGQPVGVTVLARATATLGAGSGTLAFDAGDIADGTLRGVSSSGLAGSLVGSLGPGLMLTTQVQLPLVGPLLQGAINAALAPLLSTLLGSVTAALQPVLGALDGTVDQLLAALGMRLGFADVRVTGVRCGLAALVR
jgi:uncharacterized membrane protein